MMQRGGLKRWVVAVMVAAIIIAFPGKVSAKLVMAGPERAIEGATIVVTATVLEREYTKVSTVASFPRKEEQRGSGGRGASAKVPGQGEFKFSLGPEEYLLRQTIDGEEYYWGMLSGTVPTKLGTQGFSSFIIFNVKQSKVLIQLQTSGALLHYGKNSDGLYEILGKAMGFR